MNINKALKKEDEGKSLKEILKLPVLSLQGMSEDKAQKLEEALGLKTIQDLADCKFFHWAQAIAQLAGTEE